MKLRTGILIVLLVAGTALARAATIVGSVSDITGTLTTINLTFTPLSNPQLDGGVIIPSTPKTITATNGVFSVSLEQGDYTVRVGRDQFQISVPNDSSTYNIETITTDALTYVYTVPPTSFYPLATPSVPGRVYTSGSSATPTVYLTSEIDARYGTNTFSATTLGLVDEAAGGWRYGLGLDSSSPGAIGTNLLTSTTAAAARTILDTIARSGGASTNQQAHNPVLVFELGLGSFQFADGSGDAQTIVSNELNAASVPWPVIRDYTGAIATNMAPRDQDVLNLASAKRSFVANSGGYATNLTVVISGKSGAEDIVLPAASVTNYFGWGYNGDGARMWPRVTTMGGGAAIVDNVAEEDVLNYGSALRKMPVTIDSIEVFDVLTSPASAAVVRHATEGGMFALQTNLTIGLHLAPAYVTAAGTAGGGTHKMRMVNGMVIPPRSRNNGTGYTNGPATITCGTNSVPCTITTSSGSISAFTVGYDALSTTTPWTHSELVVTQGANVNGRAMCFEWAPADYNVDSFDITAAGTGYSNGAATVTAYGETITVTLTTSGGAITAISPAAGSKTHVGDQTTSFTVTQGGGSAGTVTLNVSEYVRYVTGGTYTSQAHWKPKSINNGALVYVDITTAGVYSELPGSAAVTYGRWSRDCTSSEYWPYSSGPTFRAFVPGLGGTLIPFAGGSGYWVRSHYKQITPQMFGAVVDGSTSDSWQIQAAAYAAAYEKAALYFPPCSDVGLGGYPSPVAGYRVNPTDASVPWIDARGVRKIDMAGYLFGVSTAWTNSVLLVGSGTNTTRDSYDITAWVLSNTEPSDKASAAIEVNSMTYSRMHIKAVSYWGSGLLFRPLTGHTISKNNLVTVNEFIGTGCNVRSDSRAMAISGTSESDEWTFTGGQWGLRNPWYSGSDIAWSTEKIACNLDASMGYMSEWRFNDVMFTGTGPVLLQGNDITRCAKNLAMRNCSLDGKYYAAAYPFTRSYTSPVNCWFANFFLMTVTNALSDEVYPIVDYRTATQPAILWNGNAPLVTDPAIFWPSWKTFGIVFDADAGSPVVDPMLHQNVHHFGAPLKTAAGYVAFPGAKVWDMDALTETSAGDFPQLNVQGNETFWSVKNSVTTGTKMLDKMWGVEVLPRGTNCVLRVGNMNLGQVFVQAFNSAGTVLSDPKDVFGAYTYTNHTAGGRVYYTLLAGGSDVFLSTNVAKAWVGWGRDYNRILYTNFVQTSPTVRIVAGSGVIRGNEDYPVLPASPDGAIAPVGAIARDATYRNKLYHCGEILTTTLSTPLTNGVAVTSLIVGSTTGMRAGDVIEITSDSVPTWDSGQYDKAKAFPLVMNTTVSAVVNATNLTVSFTPTWNAASGNKVRAQSRSISGVQTASFSQAVPLNLQSVQDPVPWFPVETTSYPNGIEVLAMRVKTTTSTTYSVILKELTSPTDGSAVSVETVATSSSYEAESTSIDNPTIEAGNILYLDLPSTDIAHVTVEIDYVAR